MVAYHTAVKNCQLLPSRKILHRTAVYCYVTCGCGAGKRAEGGDSGGSSSDSGSRLLSALLTEMDGMELATGVLVSPQDTQGLESGYMGRGRV